MPIRSSVYESLDIPPLSEKRVHFDIHLRNIDTYKYCFTVYTKWAKYSWQCSILLLSVLECPRIFSLCYSTAHPSPFWSYICNIWYYIWNRSFYIGPHILCQQLYQPAITYSHYETYTCILIQYDRYVKLSSRNFLHNTEYF